MNTLGNILCDQYSIVEYQQLGTPENPASKVTLVELIDELDAVLKMCEPNRILVGHSWGATLANLYLENHHEKAIFIDPAPLTETEASSFSKNLKARTSTEMQAQLDELNSQMEIASEEDTQQLMEMRLEIISPLYHKNPATDKMLGKLGWNYKTFCQIMDEAWERISEGTLNERFAIPVIHGSHDPIPGPKSAQIISEAGHFPWLENAEQFTQSFAGAVNLLRKKGP